MTHPKENRPGGRAEATSRSTMRSATADAPDSTGVVQIPHLSSAEIAVSRPLYVLVVKTDADRIGRRVYLSLHAAVKATQRAQDRGHAVSLEMMRVVPAHTIEGGESR